MGQQIGYKATFTPQVMLDTYGSEIDVTRYIDAVGVGEISQSIDSEDYDVGVFSFGDLELIGRNKDGYFNDSNDSRSIFPYARDLCKARVDFNVKTITRDTSHEVTAMSEADTITFVGIINEEATRLNPADGTVVFRVLSADSILRKSKISEGQIADDSLAEDAIKSILNVDKITSLLTYSAGNINVDQDFTIDDGTQFDNLSAYDALRTLLVASNSILYVDTTLTIYVKARAANDALSTIYLYGPSDVYGDRENIIRVENYNTGEHRMFNSIKIGTYEANDSGHIEEYGLRQKEFSLDAVTDTATLGTIANAILDDFVVPKIEVEVVVPTSLAKDFALLQPVVVNYPLRMKPPASGDFLPIVGQTKWNVDTEQPYPEMYGSLEISPNIKFKIIEIRHDPATFQSVLKLRQDGTGYGDGWIA